MHDPDWLKSGLPHSMEHTADITFHWNWEVLLLQNKYNVRCSTVKVTVLWSKNAGEGEGEGGGEREGGRGGGAGRGGGGKVVVVVD